MPAILLIVGLSAAMLLQQPEQTRMKTVWDGAYNAEQAARGQAAYRQGCLSCHGEDFQGVAGTNAAVLIGDRFLERWREDDLGELFRFLQISMPSRAASTMTDAAKLDVLAFLLQVNQFPAGASELAAENLGKTQLTGKDGPKPLPNGTIVRAVGCLSQSGGTWILERAAQPPRAHNPDDTSPDELKSSESRPLGDLTFRLPGLDFAIPGVKPRDLRNHKVQIKGTVYRQSGNDRINARSLASLAPTCN